jgi:FtsH-binding integral membrane protein
MDFSKVLSKRAIMIALVFLVFVFLFWFVGPAQTMSKATAFFGLFFLTVIYAVGVRMVLYILDASKAEKSKDGTDIN